MVDHDSVSLDWEIADGVLRRSNNREWRSACHIHNATEKRLMQAIEILETLGDDLDLSNDLRDAAVDVYCDAFRSGVTDGRVTACVVAVALCIASRRTGHPIPMSRLTQSEQVDETKYNRCYIAVCDALDVDLQLLSPSDYLAFIRGQLSGETDDQDPAAELLDAVGEDTQFVGKDPAGVAAASVYLVEQEHTQKEVAEVVGLSTETIRQRVSDLREVADDV
ncbi:sigma factor-like helix-turn-helix DNA-binding protein [Halorubrum vacuolatum]|uniref:sigma factor-like helix-turn-helix DNA-binding protein n=1 Tax=Halorubrum vacuolatum TaxID=63740 RepID=UPI0015C6742E|nr:sigma factor-like helix-turn-helix DNA-binding protein [Halorubrum vacuolatum]